MEKNTIIKIKLGVMFLSLIFLFGIFDVVYAADYVKYVKADGNDNLSGDSDATAWATLSKVESWIANDYSATGNTATIKFNRGNTFKLTSSNRIMSIDKSNVTFDAYGSGELPVISGDGLYPDRYNAMIDIGNDTGSTVTNVNIYNLKLYNSPGGGVFFAGSVAGDYFTGPGSVKYSEFNKLGTYAINIYGVENTLGTNYAIKIEHNVISETGEYWRSINKTDGGWPASIQTFSLRPFGHECRYNTLYNIWGEGIAANGFGVVEYNNVSDTISSPIYYSPTNYPSASTNYNCIIRYNTVWRNNEGDFANVQSCGVRILREGGSNGNSNELTISIYGNMVAGGEFGLDFRNPYSGTSVVKNIYAFNNTLIDNKKNINVSYPQNFLNAKIFNNASIINADSESACVHVNAYNIESWSTWNFGPNHWNGDVLDNHAGMWSLPFYSATGTEPDITGDPRLGKTSGWRSLTAMPNKSDYSISSTSSALYNSGKYPMSFTGKNGDTLIGVTNSYAVMPGDTIYEDDGSTGIVSLVTDNTIVLNNASSFDGSGGGLSPFQVNNSLVDMGAVEYTSGSSTPTAPSGLEVR